MRAPGWPSISSTRAIVVAGVSGSSSKSRPRSGPSGRSLDLQLADLQAHAAAARQLAVGHEPLQALVERPRTPRADEGAAALAAHDLAAALERPSAVRNVPREMPSCADSSCSGGSRSPARWRPGGEPARAAPPRRRRPARPLPAPSSDRSSMRRAPFYCLETWIRLVAQALRRMAKPIRRSRSSRAPALRPGPHERRARGARRDGASRCSATSIRRFHAILDEVVAMLRRGLPRRRRPRAAAAEHRAPSGMEAGIVNLVEPGDTAVVGVSGFFGARIAEIAAPPRRERGRGGRGRGASTCRTSGCSTRSTEPGRAAVAVVHGETPPASSTRSRSSAKRCAASDALLMADCVTTLGGVRSTSTPGAWTTPTPCTQKCLGAPPGMSPLALSRARARRIETRTRPVPFSLDLRLLRGYWIDRPAAYHHTAPILHVYALHEVCAASLEEGLEERWERHERRRPRFAARAEEAGLEVLAEPGHRLAPLDCAAGARGHRRQGRPAAAARRAGHRGRRRAGAGGAADLARRPMGPNAREETADRVLAALTGALADALPVAGRRLALHLDIDDLAGVRVHAHHRELLEFLRVERRALPAESTGTRSSWASSSPPDAAAGPGCASG